MRAWVRACVTEGLNECLRVDQMQSGVSVIAATEYKIENGARSQVSLS